MLPTTKMKETLDASAWNVLAALQAALQSDVHAHANGMHSSSGGAMHHIRASELLAHRSHNRTWIHGRIVLPRTVISCKAERSLTKAGIMAISRRRGTDIHIGSLAFHSIEVQGRSSVSADIPEGHRRGIYIYQFSDGRWYAGKSEDVFTRYVQHRHEYRHNKGRFDVETIWFSEVAGNDAAELDAAETTVISSLEKQGYDLINLMKTRTPGGSSDIVTSEAPYYGLRLPWTREDRPRRQHSLLSGSALTEYETAGKNRRFEELASKGYWPDLMPLLHRYIDETIPMPGATAGTLWVATALPAGSSNSIPRTVCISCGNVETLVMFEEDGIPYGFLNIREDAQHGSVLPLSFPRSEVTRDDCGSAPDIERIWFDGLDWLADLLAEDGVLGCAYRLNVEMMRKGPTMYRRFCNPWLVRSILGSNHHSRLNSSRYGRSGKPRRTQPLQMRQLRI